MRSSRDRARRAALAGVIAAAIAGGCGADEPTPVACTTSYLTYDNFGQPFVLDWCRGCHSASLPGDMRQAAPPEINFDTLDQVRAWAPRIRDLAGDARIMPPAGGPTDAERALLVEWLACGAR